MKKKVAVILAAHGEAETGRFAENYRVSRHTLAHASGVMHIPLLLQHVISLRVSLKKKMSSGGVAQGSPQNMRTREQARILQQHLDSHPLSSDVVFDVSAAFSASVPYAHSAIDAALGHDGLVIVPMAPIDNSMSCGRICDYLAATCRREELHRVRVVGRHWNDEGLYPALIEHLFRHSRALLQTVGNDVNGRAGNLLVLLFHGTLVSDRHGRQPKFRTGAEETAAFAARLKSFIERDERNPWGRIEIAYLNHQVGGRWTTPSFEEVCTACGGFGARHVSVFAAGYFSDGNETLYRAACLADTLPDADVTSIPCLNDSPAFASWLCGRVANAATQILGFS